MSDPVTNVEIEDVLSSIRRLVSEDARPRVLTPKAPSRLVLTPALRVADAPTPVQDTEDHGAPSQPDVTEPAQVEDVPAEAAFFAHVQPSVEPVSDAPHLDEAAAEEAEHDDDSLTLEDRIAELEAVVAGQDDQWEPDGEGNDDYAGGAVGSLQWEDHLPEEDEAEDVEEWTEAQKDAVEEAEFVEDAPSDSSTPLTDWDEDALAEPPLMQDTRAQPEVDAELEVDDGLDSDPPEADLGLLASDDTILDEESLRELVADIVRQELQGVLGERITRNVRKLVRREIHRALTSQELE
ncbi:hypothetical protein [Thalassovita taeanensis]|uniref:Uncharacterized protein n=1 Tax=Thalassovita taeanensis TaxID=657014 RepID=A0A1H9FDC8_9RHOB|nr:hypothetical protein [Thalassovita taeanensis]SEQ35328.1 hypothetical protein SAMN04488092_10627 [Thalassovita taeanensis]